MKKYSAYGYLLDTRFNVVGEPTAINADGIAFWLYVGLKWEFMIALFYLPDTCYTDRQVQFQIPKSTHKVKSLIHVSQIIYIFYFQKKFEFNHLKLKFII